jgi:hypothetical protein
MKRFVPALALVAACASPATPTPPRTPTVDVESAKRAIASALDDFHDAAARADEARYFSHFAPTGVFLGTDATERWDVGAFRAFAHPYFEKGKAWSFRAKRRAIALASDGRVAWFDEDLETEKLGPARGSGVLTLDGGVWKIEQYNLATVVPNERFDEVRALLDAPPIRRPRSPSP